MLSRLCGALHFRALLAQVDHLRPALKIAICEHIRCVESWEAGKGSY